MKNGTLTVTQVNEFIKITLDSTPYLSGIGVTGEISNFKYHYASGHIYFTLKDSASQLRCVMFRTDASRLKFTPEDGMKVVCTGSVKAYAAGGTYQLYVNDMLPDGVGSLYVAFEQLKAKLEREGVFSEKLKRKLPAYPQKIGVITSQTGAAVRDIINITGRRYPLCEIYVYPAVVQGENAEKTLLAGIEYFNRPGCADLIIIGRGGGSIEDLWAFNSEKLAYAVRGSNIPVISAVGHETDFTICDFASDLRAPTPSAAAELAVPDAAALCSELDANGAALKKGLLFRIESERKKLDKISGSRAFKTPEQAIADRRIALDNAANRLESKIKLIISEKTRLFESAAVKLDSISPLRILSSGYACIESGGEVKKSVKGFKQGDKIKAIMSDGTLGAVITEVSENE